MRQVFTLTTLSIIISAFMVALLCILPFTRNYFPFWVIAAGSHIGDTLFHELGHTTFNWLFGQPAIPMIFTLFGADQAGGMSMSLGRIWFVQILAFGALGIFCYKIRDYYTSLFIPSMIFSCLIVAIAFTSYYTVIIAYMGHGSAILVGGWFLYRGWLFLDSRNQFERWLNAYLGFFLILNNCYFSYQLAFDTYGRLDYSDHVAFGISHNDFEVIAEQITRWSVKGIAIFTIGYGVLTIIISTLLAWHNSRRVSR